MTISPHSLPNSLMHALATHPRTVALALSGFALAAAGGMALAQDGDQQIRCMQLQQELASAQSGGGGGGNVAAIDRQIADANRVFQGTKAAMEDAGCFERFFIFGQGLVRSPKCIAMNGRMEDARRTLDQLQGQRAAVAGGGGNRRRQADLQDALARNGCSGAPVQQARRDSGGGGGLFGWFGGGRSQDEAATDQPQTPVYHRIDPSGRYRSVCVRTCDGFFFPISYSTYTNHLAQDATTCQSSCAAPAELYVYRNPGGEIEQAISLNGAAYSDLPNAFRYRTQYIKGCSCKEAEYNPTEIEAAGQKADATPAKGGKPAKTAAAPAATPAPAAAPAPVAPPAAPPAEAAQVAAPEVAAPEVPAPAEAAAAPAADAQQSSVAKQTPAPQ